MIACTALEDDLFGQADAAFALHEAETFACQPEEEINSDDEDDWGTSLLSRRLEEARARTVVLPDGDVHVCDAECPYAEEDPREGAYVCRYTGLVVARCCAERTDQSTGRSTWSSDPDMQSGTPLGGWGKKRDMMQASRHAYSQAQRLDDAEMPACAAPAAPPSPSTANGRLNGKRGALCVDEAPPVDVGPKRQRASKRDVQTSDMRSTLLAEAERALLDLLGKQTSSNKRKQSSVDPRLLNKEVLFNASLKKYLKETLANGRNPNMDDVSNIALAVDRVISEEQTKQARVSEPPTLRVFEPRFRESSTRLAVSLWVGACSTPYLRNAKRGADSFRPFCAGVFYAFKRGLTLCDGTVLVPRMDAFAKALPNQRLIASDPASKSLHASSHKGLCTIHKCIGSVDLADARRLFDDAIRGAKQM